MTAVVHLSPAEMRRLLPEARREVMAIERREREAELDEAQRRRDEFEARARDRAADALFDDDLCRPTRGWER